MNGQPVYYWRSLTSDSAINFTLTADQVNSNVYLKRKRKNIIDRAKEPNQEATTRITQTVKSVGHFKLLNLSIFTALNPYVS